MLAESDIGLVGSLPSLSLAPQLWQGMCFVWWSRLGGHSTLIKSLRLKLDQEVPLHLRPGGADATWQLVVSGKRLAQPIPKQLICQLARAHIGVYAPGIKWLNSFFEVADAGETTGGSFGTVEVA